MGGQGRSSAFGHSRLFDRLVEPFEAGRVQQTREGQGRRGGTAGNGVRQQITARSSQVHAAFAFQLRALSAGHFPQVSEGLGGFYSPKNNTTFRKVAVGL